MANHPKFNLSEADIERLQRGDRRLQSLLFDKHALSYFDLVKKRWPMADEDAEEIVSKAFAKFFCRVQAEDYQSENFAGYIYVIIKHLAWERLKKENEKKTVVPKPAPVTNNKNDSFLELLNNSLSQLGKKCQQLVIDFHLEKKRHKEIAAELGISEDASRQRLRECMKKLKAIATAKKGDNPLTV